MVRNGFRPSTVVQPHQTALPIALKNNSAATSHVEVASHPIVTQNMGMRREIWSPFSQPEKEKTLENKQTNQTNKQTNKQTTKERKKETNKRTNKPSLVFPGYSLEHNRPLSAHLEVDLQIGSFALLSLLTNPKLKNGRRVRWALDMGKAMCFFWGGMDTYSPCCSQPQTKTTTLNEGGVQNRRVQCPS